MLRSMISWLVRWILLLYVTDFLSVTAVSLSQAQVDTLANNLDIRVKVIDNLRQSEHNHTVRTTLSNNGNTDIPSDGWTLYFHSMLLVYPEVFPKNRTVEMELERVEIGMIQGDLYYLRPIDGFVAIKPGESRDYDIVVAFWAIQRTDFMPNWYIVSDDPTLVPKPCTATDINLTYVDNFTEARQWKRTVEDLFNPYTPQERQKLLGYTDTGRPTKLVIPTPEDVTVSSDGTTMIFDTTWRINNKVTDYADVANYLKDLLGVEISSTALSSKVIVLETSTTTDAGSYELYTDASTKVITLKSRSIEGLFYAVQSLRSILDGYSRQNIPSIQIVDKPRFQYRGLFIDVSRNFHAVDDLKRLMDAMAMYKMNKLHLHLADDEGWRLEIPGLPELTQIGGKRCHDLSERTCIIPQFGSGPTPTTSGSGYYTISEYRSILEYANKYYISVIPEFDTPGHAHAAIRCMEARYHNLKDTNETAANEYRLLDPDDVTEYISVQQWSDNAINPCIESTYNFIRKVMKEVKDIYQDKQPLEFYHFGGDEVANGVWTNSTVCQEFLANNPQYEVPHDAKIYFSHRLAQIAKDLQIPLGGWEDGFVKGEREPMTKDELANVDLFVMPWNNIWEWGGGNQSYKYANADYKVILAPATHLYFDHPQEPDPEERGLYWATRYSDVKKVLKFTPDSLYDNIDIGRFGQQLSKSYYCGIDMSTCVPLNKPENVIGIQACLWSETIRTSENIDYMVFPRFLALAERAWHKAAFENPTLTDQQRDDQFEIEWQSFARTLGEKELERLDSAGIEYRIPPPGASVATSGKIEASTTYPRLVVQYKVDDGAWMNLTDNTMWQENKTIYLRTGNPSETRFSRPVQLYKDEPLSSADQPLIDNMAENLLISVGVINNLQKHSQHQTEYVEVNMELTNSGNRHIPAANWRIYFNSLYGAINGQVLSCGLQVHHENIALYYLTPTNNAFNGIAPGETLSCIYYSRLWTVSRTDFMPNMFIAAPAMKAKDIQSTIGQELVFVKDFDAPAKWKRSVDDKYNPYTVPERYNLFNRESPQDRPYKVVPTPSQMTMTETNSLTFDKSAWVVLQSTDFQFETTFLKEKLGIQKTQSASNKYIEITMDTTVVETEGYKLMVKPDTETITISASTNQGALHGCQTLLSLLQGSNRLPSININDHPRFSYRGLMIDTSRNFKPKEWVKKMLDVMSMYKLNKLHFHLTDDEAWRIEIPDIPELTEIASNRCHSDYTDECVIPQLGSGQSTENSGSGFYTIQDYKEILQHAQDLHIEIIPEIEMPGHAAAAIAAMAERERKLEKRRMHKMENPGESYLLREHEEALYQPANQKRFKDDMNPCFNSTFRFVIKVIESLIATHQSIQPLSTIHVAGDEVWDVDWVYSQTCIEKYGIEDVGTEHLQRVFLKKVADIVAGKGLNISVWDDGAYADNAPNDITDFLSSEVHVYPWDDRTEKIKRIAEFADAGYKVVLTPVSHLYFDHPYEPDPESRGLYWGARFTDTHKVFGFIPHNITANINVDVMGDTVDVNTLCSGNPCPQTSKPENIIGMEATMFSETFRTEKQFYEMAFPRLVAMAERVWHKADWEELTDKADREIQMATDWETFTDVLGYKELPRLEKMEISYTVSPPGVRSGPDNVKVNTRYPGEVVEMSLDQGRTWRTFMEQNLHSGTYTAWFRTR